MRQSIFFFLFLALAMTVMSAPSPAKKGRVCNRARLGKKTVAAPAVKGAPAAKAAPAKAAPAKAVPAAKGAPAAKPGAKRLGRRAPGATSLCGIPIRGTSASACQGNPGFLKDPKTKVSAWTPWDTIKGKTSSLECDHALELQFTSKALDRAGFCKAWAGMLAAWTAYAPKDQPAAKMTAALQSKLKPLLNDPSMLFFVDPLFNGDKRAWTANFLSNPVPSIPTSDLSKKYFAADKRATVDKVADSIDKAASDLLSSVSSLATQGFNYDKLTDDQNTLDCALIDAEMLYSGGSPVKALWTKMKTALGNP